MRRTTHLAILGALALPTILAHAALGDIDRGDDFIVSGYMGPNQFGVDQPFSDFEFKLHAVPHDDVFDYDGPWLFDLGVINESASGQTWIATEGDPHFDSFEDMLTDGTDDSILASHSIVSAPGESTVGWAMGYFFFDAMQDGTPPFDDPDRIDLQGFDLTEIHLTFEYLVYGEKEIIPGFTFYGYEYLLRLDFYGSEIPAPPALALLGVAAIRPRRRRARER